jgi:hypothetical protein
MVGLTTTLSYFIMDVFATPSDGEDGDPAMETAKSALGSAFLVFPNFCLGAGLLAVAKNEYKAEEAEIVASYGILSGPFQPTCSIALFLCWPSLVVSSWLRRWTLPT